jgi:hypothetical protein
MTVKFQTASDGIYRQPYVAKGNLKYSDKKPSSEKIPAIRITRTPQGIEPGQPVQEPGVQVTSSWLTVPA